MENQLILEYFIEDETLCDDLIELHNGQTPEQIDRRCELCCSEIKTSSDTAYDPRWSAPYFEPIARVQAELVKAIYLYSTTFPEAHWKHSRPEPTPFNIQHYLPKQGYPMWHFENTNDRISHRLREAVWMLYLNDVPDGGTEFKFQEKAIKAEKGKMVLWPAFWTHTHRGVISETAEKYIATGWFSRTM